MTYLALPQGTADWLQLKSGVIDALFTYFSAEDIAGYPSLHAGHFAEGPFRMALSEKRNVLAIWNTDYQTGTGDESWGFILLDREGGILAQPDIGREVLERCIYVVNQRLQGLLIDGAFIHRSYDNGSHSCLAGRGSRARHFTVGYFERTVEVGKKSQRAVVCVGPLHDPTFATVSQRAAKEGRRAPSLLAEANSTQPGVHPATTTSAPLTRLRDHLAAFTRGKAGGEYSSVQVATRHEDSGQWDPYRVQGLSYEEWTAPGGPLTENQRRILDANALKKHPMRIVGPGGSGKTVLMQLLASKLYRDAVAMSAPLRILYVVHNAAMRQKVLERFETLLRSRTLADGKQVIDVLTLTDYGQVQLGLTASAVINADAHEAKAFQLERVREALDECLTARADVVEKSELLRQIQASPQLLDVLSILLMIEISTAIKGHGLENDRKRYIESEAALSRLHGVLGARERGFIFDVFSRYHSTVFGYYEVLDTDDIALSLLGRLRTPLWELKRRQIGYDYVFVDETQLFNENERRVFPLLAKGNTSHVPIALALDEAQQLYGQRTAGLATLGIKDIANESLPSIHRSTQAIVRLAFFVVQRCTDLFSAEFPDFTSIADFLTSDDHPLAAPPSLIHSRDSNEYSLLKSVSDIVHHLRARNFRQIAVICHADSFWDGLHLRLGAERLPLVVMQQRGERIAADHPVIVLSRPAHIGGQEFDAVVAVGLEQGLVPPRIVGNEALSAAVEQQALREIYLSITRARYRYIAMLSHGSAPTSILSEAERAGLINAQSLPD